MALLGLIIGSFLNVVIHRLPIMMKRDWRRMARDVLEEEGGAPGLDGASAWAFLRSASLLSDQIQADAACNLVSPRSRCPQCGHVISTLENIPLLSFLLQGGRCRHCHAPISRRYPVVELLAGVVGGLAAFHFGFGLPALAAAVLGWALIALAFIDLDHYLLPDDITLPVLWLGMALNFVGVLPAGLPASVGGAIAGYVSLWSVYWLFKLVTGKEGMGYGDFKLLAALGAWTGWKLLPLVIVLASAVGAILGIAAIVLVRRDRRKPIPFGPYLACAGWIALLYGQQLTAAYLQWAPPR